MSVFPYIIDNIADRCGVKETKHYAVIVPTRCFERDGQYEKVGFRNQY